MVFRFIKLIFVAMISFRKIVVTQKVRCIFLNNQRYFAVPNLINLNPSQIHYCLVMVSLDTSYGSCNTVDDLCDETCSTNKAKDVNLKLFNVI